MNNNLDTIYREHHDKGRRLGQSVFKGIRGDFLRKNIGKSKKVLDIGCRDGELTSEFRDGNEVIGVDIDSNALAKAKEKLDIETHQMDLTQDWGLESNTFDVVVAGEVLEHVYFPSKVVAQVASVLKKDGMFLGSVPNAFSFKNRIRLFLGQKKNTPLSDPTHINHFTRSELKSILEKNFNKVKIIPLGRWSQLDYIFPGFFSFMFLFIAEGKK